MAFVRTTVAWIQQRNIVDSCFTLNYGYIGALPWPQVYHIRLHKISFIQKVNLKSVDGTQSLLPTPGTHGMNVPTACTIVIIAGMKTFLFP